MSIKIYKKALYIALAFVLLFGNMMTVMGEGVEPAEDVEQGVYAQIKEPVQSEPEIIEPQISISGRAIVPGASQDNPVTMHSQLAAAITNTTGVIWISPNLTDSGLSSPLNVTDETTCKDITFKSSIPGTLTVLKVDGSFRHINITAASDVSLTFDDVQLYGRKQVIKDKEAAFAGGGISHVPASGGGVPKLTIAKAGSVNAAIITMCLNPKDSAMDKGFGGAIYTGSTLVVESGDITYNSSGIGGGAIASTHKQSSIIVNAATISGNYAWNGGGIYASNGNSITINDGANIIGNTAEGGGAGGGICIEGDYTYLGSRSVLTVNGGKIRGNNAAYGGGLCVWGTPSPNSVIYLNDGEVGGNVANNGGGIYLGDNSSLSMKGGVVGGTTKFTNGKGDAEGNFAINGGGIYCKPTAMAILSDTAKITHNNVMHDGGGVYVPSSVDLVRVLAWGGVTFAGNQALGKYTLLTEQEKKTDKVNISVQPKVFSVDVTPYAYNNYDIGYQFTKYIANFDTQGGNFIPFQTIITGEKVDRPVDPSKEGYDFGGWFKDPGCTTVWDFETDTVTANTSIYAKWVEKYKAPEAFEIWNWEDLSKVMEKQAEGCKDFILMQDLGSDESNSGNDATHGSGSVGYQQSSGGWTATGWTPIGSGTVPFTGSFDGNNHTISGVWVNKPVTNNVANNFQGLFGCIGHNDKLKDAAEVKNLIVNIADASTPSADGIGITGYENVGGLVGRAIGKAKITQSAVNGYVYGYRYVGGFAGAVHSDDPSVFYTAVLDCYSTGSVKGSVQSAGFIGHAYIYEIRNCYTASKPVGGMGSAFIAYVWVGTPGLTSGTYWDSTVASNLDDISASQKNTEKVLKQSNYVGFDFDNVWSIQEDKTYPYFKWQETSGKSNDYSLSKVEYRVGTGAWTRLDKLYDYKLTAPLGNVEFRVTNNNANNVFNPYAFGVSSPFANGTFMIATGIANQYISIGGMSKSGISGYDLLPLPVFHTVGFESNGGSDVAQITNVTDDALITAPPEPTKSEHTFGGWYKEASLTNIWDFGTDTVTDDIILYAKWEPIPQTYVIEFKTNLKGFENDGTYSGTYYQGEMASAPVIDDAPPEYMIEGWYLDPQFTQKWGFETDTVNSDITLYANDNIAFDQESLQRTMNIVAFDTVLVREDIVLTSAVDVASPHSVKLKAVDGEQKSITNAASMRHILLKNAGNYVFGFDGVQLKGLNIYGVNAAEYAGGGISSGAVAGVDITLVGADIQYCYASNIADLDNGNGGAVYTNSGKVDLISGTISKNIADINGGGICTNVATSVRLINSTITYNSASYSGGGIYSYGQNGSLEISGTTMSNNMITSLENLSGGGGAVFSRGNKVNISDAIFANNIANIGGAVHSSDGDVNVSGTTQFIENRAERTEVSFEPAGGGAIFVDRGAVTATTMQGDLYGKITFANNISASDGGAIKTIDVRGVDISVAITGNVEFNNNETTGEFNAGGGIYSAGDVVIKGAIFNNNRAPYYGGGIACLGSITVDNASFYGNASGSYGGGINASGSTNNISNSIFENNKGGMGGAFNLSGKVILSGLNVNNNTASISGGGMWFSDNSIVEISDTVIDSNKAMYDGGGIYSMGKSIDLIKNVTISNNSYDNSMSVVGNSGGGGICVKWYEPYSTYEDNTASLSSAVNKLTVRDDSIVFFGNTAREMQLWKLEDRPGMPDTITHANNVHTTHFSSYGPNGEYTFTNLYNNYDVSYIKDTYVVSYIDGQDANIKYVDYNNGSAYRESQTYMVMNPINPVFAGMVREGYDIVWNTKPDGSGTDVAPGAATMGNQDVVLYATQRAKPTTYLVTFDADGGTPQPLDQNVDEGGLLTKPTDPYKEGFTFLHWALVGETSAWDFNTGEIYKDMALIAIYESVTKTYYVTFDADGGTPQPLDQNVDEGGLLTKPTDPYKEGFTFLHWALVGETSAWDFNTGGIYEDMALIAIYEPPAVFEIWNWEDLAKVTQRHQDGVTEFRLMQNLGSGETNSGYDEAHGWGYVGYETQAGGWEGIYGFIPIGSVNSYESNPFTGIFEGNGHSINDIWMDRHEFGVSEYDAMKQGLFALTDGATIQNLIVNTHKDKSISGVHSVGALVANATNGTKITNCGSSGKVNAAIGYSEVGGLVGKLERSSSISNSYSNAFVQAIYHAGGLVGKAEEGVTITKSHSTGDVVADFYSGGFIGVIVDYSDATIIITDCYSTGNITCQQLDIGGFAGIITGATIENCYATGEVTGGGSVGGFAGIVQYGSSIKNCYSIGKVSSPYMMGSFIGAANQSTFENCYAAGATIELDVEGAYDVCLGGFAGYNYESAFKNCYYDSITTSMGGVEVGNDGNDKNTLNGVTPLTTAQMISTLPLGFDTSVWGIEDGKTYPYLKWQLNSGRSNTYDVSRVTYNVYTGGSYVHEGANSNYKRPGSEYEGPSLELTNEVGDVVVFNVINIDADRVYVPYGTDVVLTDETATVDVSLTMQNQTVAIGFASESDIISFAPMPGYSISGQVYYDGFNQNNQQPAHIELYDADDRCVNQTIASVFDNEGKFWIAGIKNGTYKLVAYKKNHTQATVYNIVVEDADVTISNKLVLLAGNMDAVPDGEINVLDRSLLLDAFGKANQAYMQYDLNDDGEINALDKSLMVANFYKRDSVFYYQ